MTIIPIETKTLSTVFIAPEYQLVTMEYSFGSSTTGNCVNMQFDPQDARFIAQALIVAADLADKMSAPN
jgi:hypothetical protein